jgi:hypothetical protein
MSTYCSPVGNGDILDIVAHRNVRLSEVIVSDIMDLDYLPIVFHFLDHIKTKYFLDPVSRFTDCERFQSMACELISPIILIRGHAVA